MTAKARLAALAARIEADPSALAAARPDGDALAASVGGEPGLRWHVAVLRAVMSAPPDGDAVRELYGELVDRYRELPELLLRVRALGDEIRQREADGTLPRALVLRSERRPRRR